MSCTVRALRTPATGRDQAEVFSPLRRFVYDNTPNHLGATERLTMAIRRIISYPNVLLSTKAATVVAFDAQLKKLTDDMFETMVASEGVGLAAPQIGLSLQLFVMDCEGLRLIAANPKVIETSGLQQGEEGCLSLGRIHHAVDRPRTVMLRAQDLIGEFFKIEVRDVKARCVMHETDHCEGKLFLVHLSPLQRDILIRKFRKTQKRRNDDIYTH